MGAFTSRPFPKKNAEKPVVLVTGCSEGGIGYALCLAFNEANCNVYATARRLDAMKGLPELGMKTLLLDVTSEPSIKSAVDSVVSEAGRIDILVNNAGAGCIGPVAEIPLQRVRSHLETNVIGLIAVVQQVFPQMAAQGSGKIVNIGSIVGWLGTPWAGIYCAGKAAVHVANDSLRMEAKPYGVQVMCVQPGAIRSNMGVNNLRVVEEQKYDVYKAFEGELIKRATTSQRPDSTPADVFAKQVVRQTLKKRMPAHFSYGTMSRFFSYVRYLPYRVSDFLLERTFELGGRKVKYVKAD